VIVIDLEEETSGVSEEWERIQSKAYLDRTIEVRGNVDSALITKIKDYIKNIHGQRARFERQTEFTTMLRELPLHLRYDRSILSTVLRARQTAQHAYERFLRRCKGITPRQVEGRLLEAIPSIVSLEEEDRFMQNSRAFEEVEIIFRSALEYSRKRADPNSDYNIGNCLNNLGKLARERHRWTEAQGFLRQAIEHFEALPSKPDYTQELANTYFLLGEVYAAQFLMQGQAGDKLSAIANWEKSINLDNSLGVDATPTSQKLQALRDFHGKQFTSPTLPSRCEQHPDSILLREPRFYEYPATAFLIAVVTGAASFLGLALVSGWLMGLPAGWFSGEGWRMLAWWQKFFVNIGSGMFAFVIACFVWVTLARRHLDK
jgi:tetratricopeptide (TPR) repeat protein